MKRVLLGLLMVAELAFARRALATEEAAPEPARTAELPKGVCRSTGHGVTVVVEDTSQEACRERKVQCERDHPGSEADCHSQWTENARKGKARTVPASR